MVRRTSKLIWLLKRDKKRLLRCFLVKIKSIILNKKAKPIAKEEYLSNQYFLAFGKMPNLQDPKTFNEKLLWEKIHWRNPLCIKCADKYEIRDFVINRGCGEYLNKLYFVGHKTSEINLNEMPNEFVIKSTNDSGGVRVIKNKNDLPFVNKAFFEIDKARNLKYSLNAGEWVYDNPDPKIIVEKFIKTHDGHAPMDYKFFCFWGKPYILFVASNRDIDTRFDFFDLNWNRLKIENIYLNSRHYIPKPKKFDLMVDIASKLSQGFPHVRIDMYNENGNIIIGEMTFFHQGGLSKFYPKAVDQKMGDLLDLKKIPNDQLI